MTTGPLRAGRRRWPYLAVPAALAALAALGLAAWLLRPRPGPAGEPPPADPRLAYRGPYENVRPGSAYAGDAACGGCHVGEHDGYRLHPMGRSMAPIADLAPGQAYGPDVRNPFDALGRRFRALRDGDRVWHSQSALADGEELFTLRMPVHWAVGSGTRGYSYLTEVDGFLYQTPISWFSEKGIWDLSPGFSADILTGRPVLPGCVQCHVNGAREVPGEPLRFERGAFDGLAIGCERCHGPGAAHVARHQAGAPWAPGALDPTIVNPARLPRALRDAVCEQCHLQGEARVLRRGRGWFDFRPGLPLGAFLAVFVRDRGGPGAAVAVNHVEQMRASACYKGSAAAPRPLGCTSCHDPHRKPAPAARVDAFRAACLQCHKEAACKGPPAGRKAAADSCIDCHMPREGMADVAHTSLTDHSIPRDRRAAPRRVAPQAGGRPLVLFHRDQVDRDDPEGPRDMGIALAQVVKSARRGEYGRGVVADALGLLEGAVKRAPDDAAAWVARGELLAHDGRVEESAAALERAVELRPRDVQALDLLARMEITLGRKEQAIGHQRRAVEACPHQPDYRRELVTMLVEDGRWAEALPQARGWVRLDPGSAVARQALMMCLARTGDGAGARKEMELLRKLRPDNLPELERWFAQSSGP